MGGLPGFGFKASMPKLPSFKVALCLQSCPHINISSFRRKCALRPPKIRTRSALARNPTRLTMVGVLHAHQQTLPLALCRVHLVQDRLRSRGREQFGGRMRGEGEDNAESRARGRQGGVGLFGLVVGRGAGRGGGRASKAHVCVRAPGLRVASALSSLPPFPARRPRSRRQFPRSSQRPKSPQRSPRRRRPSERPLPQSWDVRDGRDGYRELRRTGSEGVMACDNSRSPALKPMLYDHCYGPPAPASPEKKLTVPKDPLSMMPLSPPAFG